MYFEESLAFSESTKRASVGVIYFAFGTLLSCLNLSTLSVVPDCLPHVSPHSLTFFSFQLFVNIGVATSMCIPVPYMLAISQPYFMNPILQKAPSILYLVSSITAGALQFWSGLHRNLSTVFPESTAFIFSNLLMMVTTLMSFAYAISCVIELDAANGIMLFDVHHYHWRRTEYELYFYQTTISYASLLSLMFYALSVCDFLYKMIYMSPSSDDPDPDIVPPRDRLILSLLHLLSDCVYVFLVLFPSLGSTEGSRITQDVIRIFGVAFWPTLAAIVHTPVIWKALQVRIKFVMVTCFGTGQESQTSRTSGHRENRMRMTV